MRNPIIKIVLNFVRGADGKGDHVDRYCKTFFAETGCGVNYIN